MVSSSKVVHYDLYFAFGEVSQIIHLLGRRDVCVVDHGRKCSLPWVKESDFTVKDVWVAFWEALFG
jgi:hypothetical protein